MTEQQDAQGRWPIIQEAAAQVFKEKGYYRATMQDIAEAVGILPGSLYYYFRSKQELLLKLVEQPMKDLVAGAERIAASGDSPVEKLRAAIRHHISRYHYHYPQLFLVTEEPVEALPAEKQPFMNDLKRRYKDAWDKIFKEGQEAGLFRPHLDAGLIVYAILGACNWMVHWYRPDGRLTHDQIADQYIDLVFQGVLTSGSDL
jgi:AcrR family transcriptional regulator